MDFLDTTQWDKTDPRTTALRDLLARRFPARADLVLIIEQAGMEEADLSLDAPTVRALWDSTLADAVYEGGLLRRIVERASAHPVSGAAFAADLQANVLTIPVAVAAAGIWYSHPDPFQSRFVGHGSLRGVVDRSELRDSLLRLEQKTRAGLVVRGPRRCGKSYSWHLVSHIAQCRRSFVPTLVRVEHWKKDVVTAHDLATSLATKLKLTLDLPEEPSDPNEQADATARKALDAFIGAYPRDGMQRWLVIDGLDREEASENATAFGLGLLDAVANQEIVDTCVIITGLDSALSEDIRLVVDDESIGKLSFTDIRQFLDTMADHTGKPLDGLELDNLANDVFEAGDADFSVVAQRAVRQAIESFG